MRLTVRGMAAGEIDALLEFSRKVYGPSSYQATRRYLDWLYQTNPHTRGLADCLVALNQGAIVGCVHRMRLPCVLEGKTGTLASLQNHVVLPELRGGAGIMLLQRAVRGEDATLSPGVHGRLGEAYRRLGYTELPSFWLVRLLRPLKAAAQFAARALSSGRWPSTRLRVRPLASVGEDLTVSVDPSQEQLARIARSMTRQAEQHPGGRVLWDAELVRWRYFSPLGPRHLLVEAPKRDAWAVLSYGVKSRVNVVRLLELECAAHRQFGADVLRVARRLGACVALAYTTRPAVKDELVAAGWRLRGDPPASFTAGSSGLSISAAATDVGFEALLTETNASP